jgi:high-affinity K+ transport system ATPase subunit B
MVDILCWEDVILTSVRRLIRQDGEAMTGLASIKSMSLTNRSLPLAENSGSTWSPSVH